MEYDCNGTLDPDACDAHSNRLVPSIRWELLREGMEDYAYLWLLNNGAPTIGERNQADDVASGFIASRTRFDRIPTHLDLARSQLAAAIGGTSNCSGDQVTLSGHAFNSGSMTTCVARTSIDVGPDLVVKTGAELELISPLSRFVPGFRVESGAVLTVDVPFQP